LYGDDADSLLREWVSCHLAALFKAGRVGTLAQSLVDYVIWMKRCPPVGLRTALRRWTGRAADPEPELAPWLNRDFVDRLGLRDRWNEIDQREREAAHSLRPRPLEATQLWYRIFEESDAAITRQLLEFRWP